MNTSRHTEVNVLGYRIDHVRAHAPAFAGTGAAPGNVKSNSRSMQRPLPAKAASSRPKKPYGRRDFFRMRAIPGLICVKLAGKRGANLFRMTESRTARHSGPRANRGF